MSNSGFEYDFGTPGPSPAPASPPPVASGPAVPVVVLDSDQAIRSRLAMQLGDLAVSLDSFEAVERRLNGNALVVVLGPSCTGPEALASAEHLVAGHPEVGAVLIAAELTTDLFRQALRAGIKDVLAAPVETTALVESVRRVGSGLASSRPAEVIEEGELGQVITVFSTKGGAGKSVIAANLAVILARRSERPVVLVDGDLQFGDVAVMLKLAPQHTIVDAVNAIDRLDAGYLENLLVTHPPTGLRVLPSPLEPAYADQITAEHIRTIVKALRKVARYVIIDTPSYFDDKVLTLIEDSDEILLVAGMDIPNIKNVKIGLQTMRMLDTPTSKVHLILNRANTKVKLDVGEVERTLGIKAEVQLPSDIVVPQSINKSSPVVLDAPRSSIAKALESIADRYIPASQKKKR